MHADLPTRSSHLRISSCSFSDILIKPFSVSLSYCTQTSTPFPVISEGQENDPATLFARASEMMNLRKYDGALGLLNAVLEVDPNHSEAYRQRASVLRHKCR
jgi:Tfp pilus assembly protein PilF